MLKLQARFPEMLLSHGELQYTLARAVLLGDTKSPLPSMNNLFRGIPFPQDDKKYEHIQVSFLLRIVVLTRFCLFSKGTFCIKSPISRGKNDRLTLGKLLNLIGHIANKKR